MEEQSSSRILTSSHAGECRVCDCLRDLLDFGAAATQNKPQFQRAYLVTKETSMKQFTFICIVLLAGVWAAFIPPAVAQHEHPAGDPGKLGKVSFPVFQFDAFPGKSVLLEL